MAEWPLALVGTSRDRQTPWCRRDQPIAKIQDHPIILHRVWISEGGQLFGDNGAAWIADEFPVQGQFCGTRFFYRCHFRALPVGAQKVVGDF